MSAVGGSRWLMLGAGVVTIGLTACGTGGDSGGSQTTLRTNTTPWATLPAVAGEGVETTVPIDGGTLTYTIRRGDYLNKIASKAGGVCSGVELGDHNPDVKVLIPGNTLQIPEVCVGEGVTEEELNAVDEDSDSSDSSDDSSDEEVDYNTYVVKRGQGWNSIARATGCPARDLRAANPGKRGLYPGDEVNVPADCDERKDSSKSDESDSSD